MSKVQDFGNLKISPIIKCHMQHLQLMLFSNLVDFGKKQGFIFYVNPLPAEDSHMGYQALFSLNIRENIAKFVVCCKSDWLLMD